MDRRYLTCMEAIRRLDDFVDRELSADEIRLVEEHLETCARCTREIRFEERVIRDVRSKLRRIAVPPELEAGVWKRLRDEARHGPPR